MVRVLGHPAAAPIVIIALAGLPAVVPMERVVGIVLWSIAFLATVGVTVEWAWRRRRSRRPTDDPRLYQDSKERPFRGQFFEWRDELRQRRRRDKDD